MTDTDNAPDNTPTAAQAPIPDGDCAEATERLKNDLAAVLGLDQQDLRILARVEPLISELRGIIEHDAHDRTRYAATLALVATLERVGRMMNRDLRLGPP